MPIRKNAPMGFADVVLEGLSSSRTSKLLSKLDAATPWDTLAHPIKQLPEYKLHVAGRPPWEPVTILKCLMLAKWFNLSNPGLEEALLDWQDRWNGLVCKARSKVGHLFAMMKHQLGYRKMRYRGFERDTFDVRMMLMACNLKRSVFLHACAHGLDVDPVPKKA